MTTKMIVTCDRCGKTEEAIRNAGTLPTYECSIQNTGVNIHYGMDVLHLLQSGDLCKECFDNLQSRIRKVVEDSR